MYKCPVCESTLSENDKVCQTCGYHVIDGTREFKPLDVNSNELSSVKAAKKSSSAYIKVVRGPQIGMVYPLNKTVNSLGRNPKCDIFLNDMTVSREHALILQSENEYIITDKNSYNGTWVNNLSVEKKTLKAGDLIQLGAFCLVFNFE
jgi:pSer/pThr/pTyr-binding forkhead associated (FHA) protein